MKKQLLLIATLSLTYFNAQRKDELRIIFEKQKIENNKKFDEYVNKVYGENRDVETEKKIEELRANLAGFSGNVPNFYKADDQNQISNNNVDALNSAGGVSGLSQSFKGEGIKYTIFDGGRVYAAHIAFNNTQGRITNLESNTNNHSAHATGVASIIGAQSSPLSATSNGVTINGNAIGVALNSTIDSYRFATTTLPNATTTSTVFDKILIADPKISNHSYGVNPGWDYRTTANGYPANAWYWGGNYISGNNYDLMGTYYTNDQNYDAIVYDNPSYTIVKSAGNYYEYGPGYAGTTTNAYYFSNNSYTQYPTGAAPAANCSQGYDCIGYGSLAKNIIVVGATDIITSNNYKYTSSTDVIKSDYSNAGPRDDGGIKPDISAPGTEIWMASTAEDTTGSVKWQINSGTSMSAPQVAGIIGLWMQIYKSLFNNSELNAASSKNLMVHSALEAGNVGPDPWYGWGYINAKKGAEILVAKSNNNAIFNDEVLNSGIINSKIVVASGNEPLKATISWIDPEYVIPGNNWNLLYNYRQSRLINDLDLRIIDTITNQVYTPWKLDPINPMNAIKGDNTVDNVEQVILDTPIAGRAYRIEVSNKGTLRNDEGSNAPQNYSIITTGFAQILGTSEAATNKNEIIVAPTLTKDFVNILKAPQQSSYTVYDLSGKKLQSGVVSDNKEAINLSSYSNGVYIIEIKTDKEIVSKKVIKE